MTPEERMLLTKFLRDLSDARSGPKDPEAEAQINQAMSRNPDAAYLLVQHTILADQALQAAQDRIRELESRPVAASSGSFLGGAVLAPQTAVPQSAPQAQPAPSPFSVGGGLGSFLRNVGTTAAGVAGGEMLFEGLSGLFGGHRGWGGFGGYGGPVENVTINEYNDDRGAFDGGGDFDDGGNWGDDN